MGWDYLLSPSIFSLVIIEFTVFLLFSLNAQQTNFLDWTNCDVFMLFFPFLMFLLVFFVMKSLCVV